MNETQERLFDEATDAWIEIYKSKLVQMKKEILENSIVLKDKGETIRSWRFDETQSIFIRKQLSEEADAAFIIEYDANGSEKQYIVIIEDEESRYGFVLEANDSHTIEYEWGSMYKYLLEQPDTQLLLKIKKAFPIVQETIKQIRKYRLYDATGMLEFERFE